MSGTRLTIIIDEDTISRTAMCQERTKQPPLGVFDSDSHKVPKRLAKTNNPDVAPFDSGITADSRTALVDREKAYTHNCPNTQVKIMCTVGDKTARDIFGSPRFG